MENPDIHHGVGKDLEIHFVSDVSIEVLEWGRGQFKGRTFEDSKSVGKTEIKESFETEEGFEDNPAKMIYILDFLTSKMNIDDGGKLRTMLNEIKGEGAISILPTEQKRHSSQILRKMLTGDYNKSFDRTSIARRGQAYTLALYLYMHTSTDSEQEMMDTMEQLIMSYNDSEANCDEYNVDGLAAEPHLAELCTMTIEKYGLGDGMRERFKDVFERKSTPGDSVYRKNVRLVVPEEKSA